MAAASTLSLVLLIAVGAAAVGAQMEDSGLQLVMDAAEWPSTSAVSHSYPFGGEEDGDGEVFGHGDAAATKSSRRALFWHRIRHYYISYGALSANRIPCPPRSGRSYYTNNCYRARGPVHPYTRGCSAITRCRR